MCTTLVVQVASRLPRAAELATEAVEGAALALEGVDDVHGGDGLSLGVLGVGHGISDHVLKEAIEDSSGLFVDETADTFHTTSTSQPTDSGFGDTLDVITQNFAMTLGASFSQSFSERLGSRGRTKVLKRGGAAEVAWWLRLQPF